MANLTHATPADRRAIGEIATQLSTGTIDCGDVSDLLSRLRNYLPDKDPVKEVANFISHSERDRGMTFDRTEEFILNGIEVMTKQFGQMTPKAALQWPELFEALEQHLGVIAGSVVPLSETLRSTLRACVLGLLHNRSLRLKDRRVTRCDVVIDGDAAFIEFQLSGVRNVSPQMTWRIPLF